MSRILYNKHYNTDQEITTDRFTTGSVGLGEIVLCNDPGNEGIYMLNKFRELVKIQAISAQTQSNNQDVISGFENSQDKKITDNLYIKCYYNNGDEITRGIIYGVCESGDEVTLAYYGQDGYMLVCCDYNIKNNDNITLYYDINHENEIGILTINTNEGCSYIVNSNLQPQPESVEYVQIKKDEYDTIITKIEQLYSIIKNLTR